MRELSSSVSLLKKEGFCRRRLGLHFSGGACYCVLVFMCVSVCMCEIYPLPYRISWFFGVCKDIQKGQLSKHRSQMVRTHSTLCSVVSCFWTWTLCAWKVANMDCSSWKMWWVQFMTFAMVCQCLFFMNHLSRGKNRHLISFKKKNFYSVSYWMTDDKCYW